MNSRAANEFMNQFVTPIGFNLGKFHDYIESIKSQQGKELVAVILETASNHPDYQSFQKQKLKIRSEIQGKRVSFIDTLMEEKDSASCIETLKKTPITSEGAYKLSNSWEEFGDVVPAMSDLLREDYWIRGLNNLSFYEDFIEQCEDAKNKGIDIAQYGYDEKFFAESKATYDTYYFEECKERLQSCHKGYFGSFSASNGLEKHFYEKLAFYKKHGGDMEPYKAYKKLPVVAA